MLNWFLLTEIAREAAHLMVVTKQALREYLGLLLITLCKELMSVKTRSINSELMSSGLVVRADEYMVLNTCGIVGFYEKVCLTGRRPLHQKKLQVVQELSKEVLQYFHARNYPVRQLACPMPNLSTPPRRRRSVCGGKRRIPTKQYLPTALKSKIMVVCIAEALRAPLSCSELQIFSRCLSMTLERGAFSYNLATLDLIQYGHPSFISLGVTLSRRSMERALLSLEKRGLICIKRPRSNSRVFTLTVNAIGMTALHAEREQHVESLVLLEETRSAWYASGSSCFNMVNGKALPSLYLSIDIGYHEVLRQVALSLGVPSTKIKIDSHNPWISIPCPLAEWTHEGGTDRKPSAGIKIDASGDTYGKCYTCTDTTPLTYWLQRIASCSGTNPGETGRVIQAAQYLIARGLVSDAPYDYEKHAGPPMPKDVLDTYPRLYHDSTTRHGKACCVYLYQRQITPQTWGRFRVRHDLPRPVLLFPYTNCRGETYFLKGRSIVKKKMFAAGEGYTTPSQLGIFFGFALCDLNNPVVLVEGEIDVLRLHELGIRNVIASGSANWTAAQAQALRQAKELIIGFDFDTTGKEKADTLYERLKFDVPVIKKARWELASNADGDRCKDPGELMNSHDAQYVLDHLESFDKARDVACA